MVQPPNWELVYKVGVHGFHRCRNEASRWYADFVGSNGQKQLESVVGPCKRCKHGLSFHNLEGTACQFCEGPVCPAFTIVAAEHSQQTLEMLVAWEEAISEMFRDDRRRDEDDDHSG